MAITLKRASGSSIVVDTHDFCTAIFDAAGEQLAFSGWVTMHCASSVIGVRETVRLFADDPDLAPGDAIVVNDPHTCGALHQADVGIVMPMFHAGEVVGWCFSNVHVLDIGGAAIGGLATTAHDVWEEALRFPPIKIAPRGVLDPPVGAVHRQLGAHAGRGHQRPPRPDRLGAHRAAEDRRADGAPRPRGLPAAV